MHDVPLPEAFEKKKFTIFHKYLIIYRFFPVALLVSLSQFENLRNLISNYFFKDLLE